MNRLAAELFGANAIVSGRLEHGRDYVAAPITGALLAVPTCKLVQAPGCCGRAREEGARP